MASNPGGGIYSVGNLEATFSLNTSTAGAGLLSVINQTNQIRDAFKNTYKLNVDNSIATNTVNKVDQSLKQTFGTKYVINVDNSQAIKNIQQVATATEDATKKANLLAGALELGGALLAIDAVAKGIQGLGDAIFGINGKIQQSTVSMTALTGSTTSANAIMGQLENLASHSTFGLAQLTQAGQQLLAFGVSAQNVAPLLQGIQNAAAAAGGDITDKFTRINYAISELNSGIPLSDRQLRQLATAGVALRPIADQLGITVEQLYNAGKTGQITAAQFVTAFQYVYTHGALGDFMKIQAGTFNGAMALIKTNIGLAIAQGFQPLFKWVSDIAVKIGQFVQTATFSRWVSEATKDIGSVISLLKTLLSLFDPITKAIASVFGINTSNISKEMADVASAAKPDVGQYVPDAAKSTDDTKFALAGYKQTAAEATKQIADLNGEINANTLALNDNAQKIQGVKDKWDPVIQSATDAMAKINLLTPEEQARKTREMQLDVNKANKELTKPDTSQWDTRILADQTKLDNMAPLDTSTWDDNIANAQSALEKKQDEDPSAGLKGEITALQDAMSNLNTDAFDEKINAIKDKLSQPAPDTTGLTNQLAGLNAQLAGGTISQSQFNAQYGATALKKQSVLTQYQSDTSGLQGQLKLLTQERNDQALANKETAQADRQRIIDLTAQVKVKDAAHKKDLADLQDYIKAQEAARTKATKDDAAARKLLTDDIKKEGNDRANALAPYNAEMKKITDEQAHLAALDAAASAARTLALAPYKQKLEEANQAKQDGLRPLDEEKTRLDDIKMKLSEQKAAQENIKQEAEANAQQLKDAAANAGTANDNLDKTPGKVKSIGDALGHIGDKLPGPDSPFVQFIDKLREKLENIKKIIDDDVVPALGRFASFIEDHVLDPLGKFYDWLEPKIITGLGDLRDIINNGVVPRLQDFYHWIAEQITPSLEHYYDTIANHVIPTQLNFAGTLGSIVTPAVGALFDIISKSATPALTTFGDYVDQILAPVLKNFVNLALEPVRLAFDAEQLLLNNFVKPAIHDVGVVMGTEVQPIVDKFGEAFGKFNKVLSNLKDWIDKNWGGVGNALMSPFKIAFTPIANFFENLHKGINWLGQHFKLPTIDPPPISQDLSAGTGAGQAPGNNAQGTKDWRGGLSWVGETGPELMYVPQHAVIVPNQQSRAMMGAGGVPGFADGLNLDFLDNALSALGGVVKGAAGGLVDKLMNALGVPDIPGLPDAGKALVDSVKSGILDWIKGSPVEGEALGRSFATGGFNDMALKDFLAYMSSYGGPVDSEGAFNDLISVGKERGVDPRWLMAIMQTESAYGNTAGKLAPFWNFGGMEMSGRADFDSGQKATDSGADFAGYNNLKDFLEDIAQWIQQNGTSFVSYDGSGVDKNNTYQQLVQSIPIVGGAAQGGAGNNDVLADAIKYLGSRAFLDANGMTYCEGFLDTIRQDFGFARKGYGSAIEHATAVLGQLQGGPAPAGDEGFFANVRGATGWSQYGHTGVAVGDGTYISALGSGITHNQGDWESNPGYLGHGPISLAAGGYFPGNDGHLALIGEGPPEVASPVSVMEQVVRNNASNGGDINIAQGAIVINAPPGVDGRQYGQDFGNGFLTTMRTKGMVVSQR